MRIVRYYKLNFETGVLVESTERNSPAMNSGLLPGDIIIAFGKKDITGIDDLHAMLTHEAIGKRIPVTIIRRTHKLELDIVPEEFSPRSRSAGN